MRGTIEAVKYNIYVRYHTSNDTLNQHTERVQKNMENEKAEMY